MDGSSVLGRKMLAMDSEVPSGHSWGLSDRALEKSCKLVVQPSLRSLLRDESTFHRVLLGDRHLLLTLP